MIDSGITDHIVEDDMHPPFVGFLEELSGILVGTIADIADTIAVRVAEGLWIDLVEYRILRPIGHFGYLILTSDGLCRGKRHHHRHYK